MDLTVNTIVNILEISNRDVIFLLTNETAEEVVDILIDDGIEFGYGDKVQSEASIIRVLDEEEVIMVSRIGDEIYLESAYGNHDLKEYEQYELWDLFVEEELILDELIDLANVYNRLGDADYIHVFGLYLVEPEYNYEEFEDIGECTCCDCCGEWEEECDPVVEYLDEITEEALEDILMMECKCPECLKGIIGELVEESFKVGFEAGLKSVKDSIGEYLGE